MKLNKMKQWEIVDDLVSICFDCELFFKNLLTFNLKGNTLYGRKYEYKKIEGVWYRKLKKKH